MTKHKVGDVLSGNREVIAVDDSLRRYDENGEVISTGVEYTLQSEPQEEGGRYITKFQSWE